MRAKRRRGADPKTKRTKRIFKFNQAMKKLQNNFTTPEQSKRLLELGVPADSADCVHTYLGIKILPEGIVYSNYDWMVADGDNRIPCWSVGRLIEICLKCSTLEQRQVRFFCNGDNDEYSLIDYVVTVLESGVMTNHMDFLKL